MSVSVIITVTAAEGKFEILQDRLLANMPVTDSYEGNEFLRLVAPSDKSKTLVLIQQWAEIENYHAYKKFRSDSGTSALSPELVAGPPEVIFSEILF